MPHHLSCATPPFATTHLDCTTIFLLAMSERRPSRSKRVLLSLYDYTNNIAENRPGSSRGLAAGTAATLLSMSLDQLDTRNNDQLLLTDEDAAVVESMALLAEELQKSKDQTHFMDRFMERLVKHTMGSDSQEMEKLTSRISDPTRSSRPPLLIRILSSNLKRMSAKMGAFFKLQYGAIHIITWKKPTKTLSALVMYTAVCLWPHLVLALPLLVLVFGIIVPAYLYRHPMDMPELVHVRRRGQSLLEFLNESNDHSVLIDLLDDVDEDVNLTVSSDSYKSRGSVADRADEESGKNDKVKFVKSQVLLVMNMRDLQNLTTELLNRIDQGEEAATNIVGFKDERLTTFVFYIAILVTLVVLFLGKYIPWRMIFIQSGWTFLLLCHPHTKKYLVALLQKRGATKSSDTPDEENNALKPIIVEDTVDVGSAKAKHSLLENFDRNDIIVDDHPQVRIVEIYELQRRNILKHEWVLCAYTKRLFHASDPVRVAGKLPHGVDSLGKVLPPPEWKYDFGYASNWRIDQEPEHFLRVRGIKNLRCAKDGWIYDSADNADVEFRRRRLYRECYRYARPPRLVLV